MSTATTFIPRRLVRVGTFGLVGIANTIIDFGIFNVAHLGFGVPLVAANILSTSVAMLISYAANKRLVFKDERAADARQLLVFLVVTGVGLYILQTGIIFVLTSLWTGPLDLVVGLFNAINLDQLVDETFLRINGAKAIGTVASLLWNYVLYKKFVFANNTSGRTIA